MCSRSNRCVGSLPQTLALCHRTILTPPSRSYKTKREFVVGVCPTAVREKLDLCQDLQDCQEDTCLEFFACCRVSLERTCRMRRTDGNQLACRIREDTLNYHRCLGLPSFALALVLSGCSGLPSRAILEKVDPPAWNSLEIMMMDTEIVSADPSVQYNPVSEHTSASAIAAARSSS